MRTVLIWFESQLGFGHARLVSRLAESLKASGSYKVHVIGSRVGTLPDPHFFDGLVRLPGLSRCPNTGLYTLTPSGRDYRDDPRYQAERWRCIERTLDELRPDIVITEMWPIGRRTFNSEMLRLVDHVAGVPALPSLVCMARDVPSFSEGEPNWPLARDILRDSYDLVIVAGDEKVIRLEDFWPELAGSGIPVEYSGYFGPTVDTRQRTTLDEVVVTAGGGSRVADEEFVRDAIVGLSRSVLQHLPYTVHGGLYRRVRITEPGSSDEIPIRWTDGFVRRLQTAQCVISQAGYGSVTETLAVGTPTVLVPRPSSEIGDEQVYRMKRFVASGVLDAAQVVFPGPDRAFRIAQAIAATVQGAGSGATPVRLGGAASAASMLHRKLGASRDGA